MESRRATYVHARQRMWQPLLQNRGERDSRFLGTARMDAAKEDEPPLAPGKSKTRHRETQTPLVRENDERQSSAVYCVRSPKCPAIIVTLPQWSGQNDDPKRFLEKTRASYRNTGRKTSECRSKRLIHVPNVTTGPVLYFAAIVTTVGSTRKSSTSFRVASSNGWFAAPDTLSTTDKKHAHECKGNPAYPFTEMQTLTDINSKWSHPQLWVQLYKGYI